MAKQALDPELSRRLDELRDDETGPNSWSEVRDVVEGVLSSMEGDLTAADVNLYSELQVLGDYIESTKRELGLLRPEQIPTEHIPVAHDELDAVVLATEEATNTIMEAAEAIEETAEQLGGEHAEALCGATTKIYEACSFQDITGQRITKVVNALKAIEEKVDEMIATFGDDDDARERVRQRKEAEAAAKPEEGGDGHLLQGPQSSESSVSQDDIDALLASMD